MTGSEAANLAETCSEARIATRSSGIQNQSTTPNGQKAVSRHGGGQGNARHHEQPRSPRQETKGRRVIPSLFSNETGSEWIHRSVVPDQVNSFVENALTADQVRGGSNPLPLRGRGKKR